MKTSDIIKYIFMIILILFIIYFYINLIILTVQTNKRTKTFCIDTFTYNTGSIIGTAPLKSNNFYTKGIGIKCLENASIKQPTFIGSMEIPTYRTGNYNTYISNKDIYVDWEKGVNNTTYNIMGKCNVIIGEGAGKHLTTESYCVIVGSNNLAVYASGADMLWIVDWDEPYLLKNSEIKNILWNYNINYRPDNDTKENRQLYIIDKIINKEEKK